MAVGFIWLVFGTLLLLATASLDRRLGALQAWALAILHLIRFGFLAGGLLLVLAAQRAGWQSDGPGILGIVLFAGLLFGYWKLTGLLLRWRNSEAARNAAAIVRPASTEIDARARRLVRDLGSDLDSDRVRRDGTRPGLVTRALLRTLERIPARHWGYSLSIAQILLGTVLILTELIAR